MNIRTLHNLFPRLFLASGILLVTACVPEITLDIEDPKNNTVVFNNFSAFVLTRDLGNTTGAAAVIDIQSHKVIVDDLGKGSWIATETGMSTDGQYIFLVDKFAASVSMVDRSSLNAPARQFSTGTGTNPETLVRFGNKGYIPRYDSDALLIVNLDTGAEVGTVDFSEFATDVDPYPEMADAITAAGKVWVSIQRWDRQPFPNWWNPSTQPTGSYLVSIDPETDEIESRVKLSGTNPGKLRIDPRTGNLFVPLSEGIELIDPATGESKGWLIDGSDFPNGIYFSAVTKDRVFVISGEYPLDDDGFVDWSGDDMAVLFAVERSSGAITEVTRSLEGYFALSCLEVAPNDVIYTCAGPGARVLKPGLRLFNATTGEELTTEPIATKLPPVGIVFYAEETTSAVID
jgi:hypothetical protein